MYPLVINLKKRTDRLELVEAQLKLQGIQTYEIVEAISNSENPVIGCSNSHKMCIEKAINRGWKKVIVLEDDVVFTKPNSMKYFMEGFKLLPKEWDVYVGGVHSCKRIDIDMRGLVRLEKFTGLHCVAYSEKAYHKILGLPPHGHLDNEIGKVCNEIYVRSPMVAIQRNGYSDIQKDMAMYEKLFYKQGIPVL